MKKTEFDKVVEVLRGVLIVIGYILATLAIVFIISAAMIIGEDLGLPL